MLSDVLQDCVMYKHIDYEQYWCKSGVLELQRMAVGFRRTPVVWRKMSIQSVFVLKNNLYRLVLPDLSSLLIHSILHVKERSMNSDINK